MSSITEGQIMFLTGFLVCLTLPKYYSFISIEYYENYVELYRDQRLLTSYELHSP